MIEPPVFSDELQEVLRAFPFFIAWNEDGVIVATGPSLLRFAPAAQRGEKVAAVFLDQRQIDETLFFLNGRQPHEPLVITDRASGRTLRGSMIILPDSKLAVMLASPWITTPEQLRECGLKLKDFGPHDQTLEILQIVQSQQMGADDLAELNRALNEERAKYRAEANTTRSLLRNASDGIHILDRDGHLIYASDSFARMLGYEPREVIGMHVSQWDAYFKADELQTWVQKLFASESVTTFETLHRRKDGESFEVEVTAHAVLSDGASLTLFCSSRDVTQRKRQAARLESLNARLEATIGAAMDAVIVMDTRGSIIEFNAAGEQIFGYRRDEVIGRQVSQTIVPERHREAHARGLAHYLNTGDGPVLGNRIEVDALRKDGTEFSAELEMDVARTPEGEFFVAFLRDISERKSSEEALRQYRDTLEEMVALRTEELESKSTILDAIVNTSPSGLLLADTDGRIFMTNPALEKMFGYGPSELIGQYVEQLIPESIRAEHQRHRVRFALDPKPRGMGYRLDLLGRRADGTTFPSRISLTSFHIKEKLFIQATVIDTTEQKRHEEELRELNASLEMKVALRTAELGEASAAKSTFLAHMSHEIRTPMNGILGLAQLLERSPLSFDQRDMVLRIQQAGKSLLAIINDVLDFSKIEAGELRIENQPFRLGSVLSQVDSLLGPTAHSRGLEIFIETPTGFDDGLIGDAFRLEQILMNLVSNAIKFSEQTAVRVDVKVLRSSAVDARLRFEVKDKGIGISEENQKRLFTPFTQADASITRQFGGTGLGLAISRCLVELMGGEIGVFSTLGIGSTFWIEIPFQRQKVLPSSNEVVLGRKADSGPRLSGLRCLVVDDSRMNRDVVERILTIEGAKVTTAVDGRQALATLETRVNQFDVVLMDIQMPLMDGLTATRIIRANPLLRRLPIIALTAGVLPDQVEQAKAAGCDDFLAKPVDFDQLVGTLMVRTGGFSVNEGGPVSNIPGIEPHCATVPYRDDPKFFVHLLEEFVREFGSITDQVRSAISSENFGEAARLLHMLRGSCGYIGAVNLQSAIMSLEKALLEEVGDVAAQRFFSEADTLMRDLREFLNFNE